jgi:hypothetical protein
LPRELLADGKQHGHELLFVGDSRNQFKKLEDFEGFCIPFRWKRKQDDCF